MTTLKPLALAALFRLAAIVAPAIVALLIAPARANAQEAATTTIRIPITIDYLALTAALRKQLYTDNGRAPFWNGSDRCQYLYAENPSFSASAGQARLETGASVGLGVEVGGRCISPISWSGIIAADAQPYITPNMILKLRLTNLDVYDAQHRKTLLVGKAFDLIKQYLIPQIETFAFDLKPAVDELTALVDLASPPETAARVKQALATLRAEPAPAATAGGIRAVAAITVPASAVVSAPAPAAPLTPQELDVIKTQLDQWDAFLVFSIKQLGVLAQDQTLRAELFSLLLDSRHRLVDALANPQAGGADPVRILFIDVWHRLGEIIRAAAQRGTLGDRALPFLSFITAGDALFAFDQAAPALGMRISADDLRRLAHIVAPMVATDPLAFSFEEDPELRRMFNVAEPLSAEGPLDTAPSEVPTPTPSAAPSPPSAAPSPGARAAPAPLLPGLDAPQEAWPSSWLGAVVGWFEPASAFSAEPEKYRDRLSTTLQRLSRKLRRAVVNDNNAAEYRVEMGQLIRFSAEHEFPERDTAGRFHALYIRLVQATAWQESCWRQFVVKGGRVVYLESSSHDIGLMQVNKYVWRGFYSVPRLEWDVLYNASAGAGILAGILHNLAAKPDVVTPRHPDDLARSCYAVYNGGPQAYRRWRKWERDDLRRIDESFWSKYQSVLRSQPLDIMTCAAQWNHSPGH
jgi:hypothetical protein